MSEDKTLGLSSEIFVLINVKCVVKVGNSCPFISDIFIAGDDITEIKRIKLLIRIRLGR